MTELLIRLKRWLPKENTIPEKYLTMKQMLKDLGMKVECIHACENDCILFWKEYNDALECPRCHTSRFKVKKSRGSGKNDKTTSKSFEIFSNNSKINKVVYCTMNSSKDVMA